LGSDMSLTEQYIKSLGEIEDMQDRLAEAARLADGHIIEIGAGEGVTTLRFLQIAEIRGSKVIVIDPFEQIAGADESYFKPYSKKKFIATVDRYLKNMYLVELPSQAPEVRTKIGELGKVGFVFIDGLQDKESVMSDIRLAASLDVEIICIDDYDRLTDSSQVPLAVDWYRQRLPNYKFIYNGQREVYFLKCA
jgi:hypothetical protein